MHNSETLSAEQGNSLIRLARKTIAERLDLDEGSAGWRAETPGEFSVSSSLLQEKRGTFVTLKIKGQLRGCMGCLTPTETILEGVQRNAINAAFNDPRFPGLTEEELAEADIEVSILTEPQPLDYTGGDDLLAKLRPKVDGVILKKGYAQATFLPQVWEQLPRTEDFLAHLCRKAGLTADAWQSGELEVSTYQVQYFHEQK
jgi:AmmeMemoRadiSam system protein A